MAITEIALLHLLPDIAIDNLEVRSKLAHAKMVMQNYTGRTFYFLQQVEDPTYIYVIGEWESLDQHMKNFIPSSDNQELLEGLKHQLAVEWLLHIDVPHTDLPLPSADGRQQKAPIYGIVRHFIKESQKEQFKTTFDAEKHHLQDFLTEGRIGGGWRVDQANDREEWVVITPWTSVEQHQEFAKTDGFTKYGKIREYIEGAEIKHAHILDL